VERCRPDGGVTAAGDLIDPWLGALLEAGWALLSTIGKKPPLVPGWELSLDSNGEGSITTPALVAGSEGFLDRLPPLPGGWSEMVTRQGQVTVFAAQMGLAALSGASLRETSKALSRAASHGQLVAASIAVSQRQPVAESTRVRHRLAATLEEGLRERARRDRDGPLNSAPDLVLLPAPPRISPLILGAEGMPGMLVDLNAPPGSVQQVEKVFAVLLAAGFRAFRSMSDGPLPMPPDNWSYLLWRSQILILTGADGDKRPIKLLFEPFQPARGWYEHVQSYRAPGLAVLVGDLHLASFNESAVLAAMGRGEVLASTLAGMRVE
jgi:hypothetical protein